MCVEFQGTQVKDVIIKPDAPSTLLLEKHADYIAAYGSKKDDYVSTGLIRALICVSILGLATCKKRVVVVIPPTMILPKEDEELLNGMRKCGTQILRGR